MHPEFSLPPLCRALSLHSIIALFDITLELNRKVFLSTPQRPKDDPKALDCLSSQLRGFDWSDQLGLRANGE
jgi:hypothetical protein